MFEPIGFCRLIKEPTKTDYFWGPVSVIGGAELKVLEKASNGDCLCMTEKGLVDVHKEDIAEFRAIPVDNLLSVLTRFGL